MKKAQVSMFILLGIIVLVFAGLVFYLTDVLQTRPEIRVVEASSAKQLVEHCLGAVAEDALLAIGKQGGFAVLPENYFAPLQTAYLYDLGQNNALGISGAEQELSHYIEDNLNLCIDDFNPLEKKGITVIALEKPVITAIVAERDVQFSIGWEMEEHRAGSITKPEFVPVRKAVRLKEILELAYALAESQKNNNGLFDLDLPCALEVLHFPMEQALITVITDSNYLIQNKPFRFVFANRR